MKSKKIYFTIFLFLLISLMIQSLFSQKKRIKDIEEFSLNELLNIKISVASKNKESLNDAPGIVSIITAQEIEGFAAKNLGEVLNRVAGAEFMSTNMFADNMVQFRGEALTPYNNHVLILINGRPLRDPISGGLNGTFYTSFPVTLVDHIEIIRGPGSVLYGSCAFSGVINVITKGNKKTNEIVLSGGSYNTLAAETFLTTKNGSGFNFQIGARYLKTDGPKLSLYDFSGQQGEANFDKKNIGVYLNMGYKNLNINGFFGKFDKYSFGGANVDWTNEPHSVSNLTTSFFNIDYKANISSKIKVNMDITYNRKDVDMENNDTIGAQDLLFEVTSNMSFSKKLDLVIGGTYERENYFGDLLIENSLNNYSFYFQLSYKLVKQLKLITGIQYNKIENIDGDFSPRLGIIGYLTDNMGIKVLYSKAFRKAYPLETSFNYPVFKGNLSIKPEKIETFETQMFFQNKKTQMSFTFFAGKIDDIIIRNFHLDPTNIPFGFYLQYANGPFLNFWGLEYEGKYSLISNLMLISSITYQKNKDKVTVNGEEIERENHNLHPNLMVKAGLLYNKGRLNIGIYNMYVGDPTQVSKFNSGVLVLNKKPEAHNILSFRLSYTIINKLGNNGKVTLRFDGENLMGKEVTYPEFTSRLINSLLPLWAGRELYGSIIVKF